MEHLGEKLKKYRKAKELSQSEMATELKVGLRTYQGIEKTGKVAKSDLLEAIQKRVGLNTQKNARNNLHNTDDPFVVTTDLSKWMGNMQDEIIRVKARVTVCQVTLEKLVSDTTGKAISTVTVELQKAIADLEKILFADLREQQKKL
jgi:transcriptional regulator with XRE-family HTH domain